MKMSMDNIILSFAIEYDYIEGPMDESKWPDLKPLWLDIDSYCLGETVRLYDTPSKSMPSMMVVNKKSLKMDTFDDALVLGVPRKRSWPSPGHGSGNLGQGPLGLIGGFSRLG